MRKVIIRNDEKNMEKHYIFHANCVEIREYYEGKIYTNIFPLEYSMVAFESLKATITSRRFNFKCSAFNISCYEDGTIKKYSGGDFTGRSLEIIDE